MNPEARSALMSRIKSKNTKPEITVRKILYSLGYRYRIHRKELPGSPDVIFSKRKKVIFIHGCFWHAHDCGRGFKPKTNVDFWKKKLDKNCERDRLVEKQILEIGWQSLTIWECQLKNETQLIDLLKDFLGPLS